MQFREDDIEHAEVIVNHFGYWPSFHDAEIISVRFFRDMEKSLASLEMRIYVFEVTGKLMEGFLEQTKHCFIDLEFIGLKANEIGGFNHQNIVDRLRFGRRNDLLFCELSSAYGAGGYIEATTIRVQKLTLGMSSQA
jgi:hypothetical protein